MTNENSIIIFIVVTIIAIILIIVFSTVTFSPDINPVFTCQPGQCVLNNNNGSKVCSDDDNISLEFNILSQSCTNKTSCSGSFPFAVKLDGSTDNTGQCDVDPTTGDRLNCRCVATARCPYFTSSVFVLAAGSPVGNAVGQSNFVQAVNPVYSGDASYQEPDNTGGMIIDSNNYCTVPLSWVFRSDPGCRFTSTNNSENITNCFFSNPCLQGTLAAITGDDRFSVLSADINTIRAGCVVAPNFDPDVDKCPSFSIPVFDTGTGTIICTNF